METRIPKLLYTGIIVEHQQIQMVGLPRTTILTDQLFIQPFLSIRRHYYTYNYVTNLRWYVKCIVVGTIVNDFQLTRAKNELIRTSVKRSHSSETSPKNQSANGAKRSYNVSIHFYF